MVLLKQCLLQQFYILKIYHFLLVDKDRQIPFISTSAKSFIKYRMVLFINSTILDLLTLYYLVPKLLIIQIYCCSHFREVLLTFFHAVRSATRFYVGAYIIQTFINNFYDRIRFSEFLLFADDLKVFRVIKSPDNCKCDELTFRIVAAI
jgi:hypothetical protein